MRLALRCSYEIDQQHDDNSQFIVSRDWAPLIHRRRISCANMPLPGCDTIAKLYESPNPLFIRRTRLSKLPITRSTRCTLNFLPLPRCMSVHRDEGIQNVKVGLWRPIRVEKIDSVLTRSIKAVGGTPTARGSCRVSHFCTPCPWFGVDTVLIMIYRVANDQKPQ